MCVYVLTTRSWQAIGQILSHHCCFHPLKGVGCTVLLVWSPTHSISAWCISDKAHLPASNPYTLSHTTICFKGAPMRSRTGFSLVLWFLTLMQAVNYGPLTTISFSSSIVYLPPYRCNHTVTDWPSSHQQKWHPRPLMRLCLGSLFRNFNKTQFNNHEKVYTSHILKIKEYKIIWLCIIYVLQFVEKPTDSYWHTWIHLQLIIVS